MSSKPKPNWKKLEDETRIALEIALSKAHPIYTERIYDSKSAGTFLNARSGDFEVCYAGLHVKIECKYSAVTKDPLKIIKKSTYGKRGKQQEAMARLFMRAGGIYLYLVKNCDDKLFVLEKRTDILKSIDFIYPDLISLLRNISCRE